MAGAYEIPRVPTSVFVLLPKTAEEREFAVVVDKGNEGGRKLPGGGASKDRAVPSSGATEVFEETKLVINPPTLKILEVHKTGPNGSHHWIAVKSLPPVSCEALAEVGASEEPNSAARIEEIRNNWPIRPGADIAEAWWSPIDEITRAIAEHKFFTDHGRAVKWYLSGRSQSVVDEALRNRKIISWFVDETGCLVLCYDPNCDICDRDEAPEPPEETMETLLREESKKTSLLLSAQVRQLGPKAVHPASQLVAGEVEVVFLQQDKLEDRLWLMRDFAQPHDESVDLRRSFHHRVNSCTIKLEKPTTVASVAEMFFVEAKRQVTVKRPNGAFCLISISSSISSKKPVHPEFGESAFAQFNANADPPHDLLVRLNLATAIAEAVDRFNRTHPDSKIWAHNGWLRLYKEVEYKTRLRGRKAVVYT